MTRFFCGLSLLVMLTDVSPGQQPDPLDRFMERRTIHCSDVTLNMTYLLPQYFRTLQFDSMKILTTYWDRKCGAIEPVTRTRILVSLHLGSFSEEALDTNTLRHLLLYRERRSSLQLTDDHERDNGERDYALFTTDMARSARDRAPSGSLGRMLADFYGGTQEGFFRRLRGPEFIGSRLQEQLLMLEHNLREAPEYYLGTHAGVWEPTGNAAVLGTHPLLGMTLGVQYPRFDYRLLLEFRFGNTPTPYTVEYLGVTRNTNYFFGGCIGGQIGVTLFRRSRQQIGLLAGIAGEGFSTQNAKQGEEGKDINSLAVQIGCAYRWYPQGYGNDFIEIQPSYSMTNYINSGGTNLQGHALTLRLGYAWGNDWGRNELYQALEIPQD